MQVACIFASRISHHKSTLKFACKKSACKSLCKILHASFLLGFFVESTILHAIYVRVSAAVPMACTVNVIAVKIEPLFESTIVFWL